MSTFPGYRRPDGQVGVRNHVAVLPTVSCANGVAAAIAREVPEVVPLYHGVGCGRGGTDLWVHPRTFENLCRNPNFAAVLLVGLGCEIVGAANVARAAGRSGKRIEILSIQDEGGSRKTAAKGIALVREMVAEAARAERAPFGFEHLTVGLECGGSDAFSGITANPSVGVLSDWLVDQGATVLLTETTEMIGTAHILARRATDASVADKVTKLVDDQEEMTQRVLGPMAKMAIAPGNMDGGMSSIREKSLGCIVKAGTRPISAVVDYAEVPETKGLVVMHGPGYDTESMTGLAAGGAQIIVFTTGRGNPIGFPGVPVVKVASTTQVFTRLEDDIDVNAGAVLEGSSIEEVGQGIVGLVQEVAGGRATKAELNAQDGILCVFTQTTSF